MSFIVPLSIFESEGKGIRTSDNNVRFVAIIFVPVIDIDKRFQCDVTVIWNFFVSNLSQAAYVINGRSFTRVTSECECAL